MPIGSELPWPRSGSAANVAAATITSNAPARMRRPDNASLCPGEPSLAHERREMVADRLWAGVRSSCREARNLPAPGRFRRGGRGGCAHPGRGAPGRQRRGDRARAGGARGGGRLGGLRPRGRACSFGLLRRGAYRRLPERWRRRIEATPVRRIGVRTVFASRLLPGSAVVNVFAAASDITPAPVRGRGGAGRAGVRGRDRWASARAGAALLEASAPALAALAAVAARAVRQGAGEGPRKSVSARQLVPPTQRELVEAEPDRPGVARGSGGGSGLAPAEPVGQPADHVHGQCRILGQHSLQDSGEVVVAM